jgi:tetratricopeptide (TPR) repeat protein
MLGTVETLLDVPLARRHLDDASAVLARTLGPTHELTIAALSNRGLLDRTAGDLVAAEQAFSTALARLSTAEAPDPLALATLHHNEATALIDLDRDADAVEHLEHTLALRRSVGVDTTQLAMTLTVLGGALWRIGRVDEAREALERALATEPDVDDPNNRAVRRYFLAGSLAGSDRPRALRLLADAIRLLEGEPDRDLGLLAECRALAGRLRDEDRSTP